MWRLVAACGGSGLRPCGACQPPAVARGHPSAKQGQAPAGRACGAALLCSSPAPVAASVLRAAPPPRCGGCGAVRPSGPGGGAPASLASAATAYGGRPCRSALPPPSPPGVAAPPACGVPPPSRGRGPRVARLRPLVRGLVLAAPRGPCAAAI